MKNSKIIPWMLCLALASCGRPATTPGNDVIDDGATETTNSHIQESVVPVTGGQATSHDGILSIVFSPLTFEQLVTVSIEKLETLPASESKSIFGAYRVSLSPDTAALPSNKTVRIQFTMAEDEVEAVGISDMRVVLRTDVEAQFDTQQEARYLDGKVWSTSSVVVADFGLVRTTEPNTCECNIDDSCSENCSCDPDCGENPDPSDTSTPTNCQDGEFACHSGDQCIPQIYFCDGLPQCNDGSDETDNACNGTTGPNADQYEPDNTYSQATVIAIGESQTHTLPAGDGDFVKFTLETRQEVLINAVSSFLRPTLTLYTENQSQIASTSDGFFEQASNLNEVLEAGTYFVYAFSQDGNAVNSYSISVQASEPLAPGPSNLSATINAGTAILTWDNLEGAASYNVYYGEMPGGPYTPFTAIASEGQPPLNTEQTTFSLNGFPAEYPIYAVVRAVDAEGTETYPSNEVTFQVPLSQDAFEPDNSFSTASNLSDTAIYDGTFRQTHSAHVADDQDYIRFELTGWKNNITITTSGPGDWDDTELYLYNASQGQIAYNDQDEQTFTSYSRIQMSDLPAGVYYILARSYEGWSSIGTYYVDVAVEVVAAPSGQPDGFEVDNSIEDVTASATNLLTPDTTQSHSIHQDGDVDFARIELAKASDLRVDVSAESSGIMIRLYDVHGTELSNTSDAEPSNSLTHLNLPAGTFFVSISNSASPQFIASYDLALTVYEHPDVPGNLVATPGVNAIALSWDAVTPSTGYLVQYSYSAEGPFETVEAAEGASPLTSSGTSLTLTGLPTQAHTFICVRSVNGTAQSECSDIISATPLAETGN